MKTNFATIPALLQDWSKPLGDWFASKPEAKHLVRRNIKAIIDEREDQHILELAEYHHPYDYC
jgi:hypothetical protein